jgi:hypothetical protein
MPLSGFDDVEIADESIPEDLPKWGVGAPKKIMDYTAIERAASIGCTKEEIAAVIGVAPSTLYLRINDDPAVLEAIERGSNKGKATLRRLQWKGAQNGNSTMLMWLGKQLLGQREFNNVQQPDDGKQPITIVGGLPED